MDVLCSFSSSSKTLLDFKMTSGPPQSSQVVVFEKKKQQLPRELFANVLLTEGTEPQTRCFRGSGNRRHVHPPV